MELEAIILARESILKKEIENKEQEIKSIKCKYERERLEDAAELEKGRNEILELREKNLRLAKEVEQGRDLTAALKSEANFFESAKNKAEMENEVLNKRFKKLDEMISSMEKDIEMSSQANQVFVKAEPNLLNEDEDAKPVVANKKNPGAAGAPLPSVIISIDSDDESERITPQTKGIKRKEGQAPILDKRQKSSPVLVDVKAEGNHDRAKHFDSDHRHWMQKALVAKQNPNPLLVDIKPPKIYDHSKDVDMMGAVDSRRWMQKTPVKKY